MTISIPDTFTIDHSENYILSIRLTPDGFSFSIHNPLTNESPIFRNTIFDLSVPYINSLKEVFFANHFLLWNFKCVYILVVTPQFTLSPSIYFSDKHRSELISFNFSQSKKKQLSDSFENNQIINIYNIDEEVYEFCIRSLINPVYVHHITPLLTTFKKQNSVEKNSHMFVNLHSGLVDIICYSRGKLILANSFAYEHSHDLLYYILYAWRQLKFNQLSDRISLAGEVNLCRKISESLSTYIQQIGRIEIPSEVYLKGGEILQAPMDLILLSVCEL